MLPWIKRTIKYYFGPPAAKIAGFWPTRTTLYFARQLNGIQLTVSEMFEIATAVRRYPKCRFLVFGLGNDSLLWARVNRRGHTLFVEDGVEWFKKKTEAFPELKGVLVEYNTTQGQWRDLIDRPDLLATNFPAEVEDREWDVILVDGPVGYGDETTGRMKSIYLASRLVIEGGDVFVHDADRIVESSYATQFLKAGNLVRTTERLNHYRVARGKT